MILNSEHFKASVAAPQGKHNEFFVNPNDTDQNLLQRVKQLLEDENDDEFFHLTCHVEPSLRQKIERGEYVDLEKLLPWDRFPHRWSEDCKIEMGEQRQFNLFHSSWRQRHKSYQNSQMGASIQGICSNLLQSSPSPIGGNLAVHLCYKYHCGILPMRQCCMVCFYLQTIDGYKTLAELGQDI